MPHKKNRITSWISTGKYKIYKEKGGKFSIKVVQTAEFIIDKRETVSEYRDSSNPRHFPGGHELIFTIPFSEVLKNYK